MFWLHVNIYFLGFTREESDCTSAGILKERRLQDLEEL